MRKLDVILTSAPGVGRLVGRLAEEGARTFFEYDSGFLESPLWLSPFKLPPAAGLREHRDRGFGPLFGLFDDSLPDGWGLLLMDCHFQKAGLNPRLVSPLDRLAFLGTRTMGALTYHPPMGGKIGRMSLDLASLARDSRLVLEGKAVEVLPALLLAGGSPGGARPKVLVGIRGDEVVSGVDDLPDGFTPWLVKFPRSSAAIEDGRVEYAYSLMARAAGVEMPETSLFPGAGRQVFFGARRFDRESNRRLHAHTFGNLIHANFRVPGCDYTTLLAVTRTLTKKHKDVLAAFRVMVFNIMANNRDDHVKNFAFLMDTESGEWRLAPAYDLTFAWGPGGEHSMMVAGEGKSPGMEHAMEAANQAEITIVEAETIVGEVGEAVSRWGEFARKAGVSKSARGEIGASLRHGEFQIVRKRWVGRGGGEIGAVSF